jgi:hypothetical protein
MDSDKPAGRIVEGSERDKSSHWAAIVKQWDQVGPPLRPSPEDIGFCTDIVHKWCQHKDAPRVLLFGVTPELFRLSWPAGTNIVAVDNTQAMIDNVWPGPKEAVQCKNWLDLALPDKSRDIALCDGGLHLLAYPKEQQKLVHILSSVVSEGGLCILRLFVPPKKKESSDIVLQDFLEGRIPDLNILKLRLAMSLMDRTEEGVELGNVWHTVYKIVPDLEVLAVKIGWLKEHMLAINAYRGSKARYYFATADQVIGMFCKNPGGFKIHTLYTPSYELGEQCPTIVFQCVTSSKSP